MKKTEVTFRWPKDYDLRRVESGVWDDEGEKFRVVAEFTGWAADYVAEGVVAGASR
ncbi:MAG: hypothetical protein R3D98_15980 [Candidatus Krumholzibacteriia bacterium]